MVKYIQKAIKEKQYIPSEYLLNRDYEEGLLYELYAVNNHFGSLMGGHYQAYAKNGKDWYEFNDTTVTKISEEKVQSPAAYMLFYRRMES